MRDPLFSIVIANYNYGHFLAQAIESVAAQSCDDFELIVVDGGSTDDSVSIIERHAAHIAWWCSEKDRGQSHAFNKGFAGARGRFLSWLNADDFLLPGTLEKARLYLDRHPRCRWLAGNTIFVDDRLRIQRCAVGPPWVDWLGWRVAPYVYGPSSFFARDLFQASRGFDENLRYGMDGDLWGQFQQLGAKYHRLRHFCWAFRMHDESVTSHAFASEPSAAFQREREEIARRYSGNYTQLARASLVVLKVLTAYPATAWNTWRWQNAALRDYIKATGGPAMQVA
jgi:glycosyltransferase involved in cell wall biosynthesis